MDAFDVVKSSLPIEEKVVNLFNEKEKTKYRNT